MTRRLSPRHRRTTLRNGGRPLGHYEQCDFRDAPTPAAPSFDSMSVCGGLVVSGLVASGGIVPGWSLRMLAGSERVSDLDARKVGIVEFLGAIRLDADAELLIWSDPEGDIAVTTVAQMISSPSTIVLGGDDLDAPADWRRTPVLSSPLLSIETSMPIASVVATTFADFVGDS